MRQALYYCFILLSSMSLAQTISFIDAESHLPVENAFVIITSTNAQPLTFVTDASGKISFCVTAPYILQVRHLNYSTVVDTLNATDLTLPLTPNHQVLKEVVVTGQHQPHSAENSIYRVRTISKERIRNQGAITIDDVLKTELNVRIIPDLAISSSSMTLQGMVGQNVKVLVNGVPLVNRNGNGNDADLSQINVQEIEQIEIVEGPMAINYGANALAAVINIITKKSTPVKAEITATMHEESAGAEYGLQHGKHIQRLGASYNLSRSWYTQLNVSKNNFLGYQGDFTGRQKEWNPKNQWVADAMLKHAFGKHTAYYKLDYLNELIVNRGQQRESITSQGQVPYAFDEEYKTQRFTHQIQADGKLGQSFYNLTFSYSDFDRFKHRFFKDLTTGNKTLTTADGDQDTTTFKAWVFRGTLSDTISSTLSLQAGYDFNIEHAGGMRISNGIRSVNDFGFFSSVEWSPDDNLKLRPGLRYAINSIYKTPLLPSLNVKYNINTSLLIRAAYGRGYRAPSLRELYFEFVDSNHKIYGNDKLKPEYSNHVDLYITKYSRGIHPVEITAGAFFNDMNNQIAFMQSATDATVVTYLNVLKYKTIGFTAEQKSDWNDLSTRFGFTYTGRYNQLSENDTLSRRPFFFSPEVNINLGYQLSRAKLKLNLFYKYTGALKNYIGNDTNNLSVGRLADFHWIDLTFSKAIVKNLNITGGIKNLLNVQRLSNSSQSRGLHSGGASQPLSYGRSYFLSINYTLTIKEHDEHL